jgi:hypothetical protein
MATGSKLINHRAVAKQQMSRNVKSEKFDPTQVDPRSREETQMFIDSMEVQMNDQINLLESAKTNELNKLEHIFDLAMPKLNKQARQMTVAEFNAVHDCDIVSIIRDVKKNIQSQAPSTSSSVSAFSTPAMARRNKLVEPTPPRTVRRGEKVVSENGSPIDLYEEGTLVATVTKNRRQLSTEIYLGQGKSINIGGDANEIKELSLGQKAMARDRLKALRDELDELDARLLE